MIQNFGGGELIVIILLALVVLGPERIPEMAKGAGKMIARFKTMTSGLQGQVQGVMDDPAMQPLKELGDFAARPRQKLAEYALEAEADERAKAEKASIDAAASTDTASTDGAGTGAAGTDAGSSDGASTDAASSDAATTGGAATAGTTDAAPTDGDSADTGSPDDGRTVTSEERETA